MFKNIFKDNNYIAPLLIVKLLYKIFKCVWSAHSALFTKVMPSNLSLVIRSHPFVGIYFVYKGTDNMSFETVHAKKLFCHFFFVQSLNFREYRLYKMEFIEILVCYYLMLR